MHLVAFLNPPTFLCITAVLLQSMKVYISLSCSWFLCFYDLYKLLGVFLTHMLLLLVFVSSFNLFSLPFSIVSTFSHGPSFLILVPFLTINLDFSVSLPFPLSFFYMNFLYSVFYSFCTPINFPLPPFHLISYINSLSTTYRF